LGDEKCIQNLTGGKVKIKEMLRRLTWEYAVNVVLQGNGDWK
jgi:hypothetical protein